MSSFSEVVVVMENGCHSESGCSVMGIAWTLQMQAEVGCQESEEGDKLAKSQVHALTPCLDVHNKQMTQLHYPTNKHAYVNVNMPRKVNVSMYQKVHTCS